jgi:hypothetical protein
VGLLDNLRGNASEVDATAVGRELEALLTTGETVAQAYAVFRDLFVFTTKRLIIVDKQGMTGKKVTYRSIPYRSIVHFKVETAGLFDADSELTLYLSGGAAPVTKPFGRKSDIAAVQKVLAAHVAG